MPQLSKTSIHNQGELPRVVRHTPFGTKGATNVNAKLNDQQVLEIFRSAAPTDQLAAQYGIHANTVRQIRRGARWSWLTGAGESK